MIEEFYYLFIIILIYYYITNIKFCNYDLDNNLYDIYVITKDSNKDNQKYLLNNINDNIKFYYETNNNIVINNYIKPNILSLDNIIRFNNHYNLWNHLKIKSTSTLILEDNINILDLYYDNELHKNIPKDFDIFYFGSEITNVVNKDLYNTIYKSKTTNSLFAYLISQKGINKLINHFDKNQLNKQLDKYLLEIDDLITYSIFPSVITILHKKDLF